jgi:hypothetical protein
MFAQAVSIYTYPDPLNIAEVRGHEIQEESLRFAKKIVDTQFEDT